MRDGVKVEVSQARPAIAITGTSTCMLLGPERESGRSKQAADSAVQVLSLWQSQHLVLNLQRREPTLRYSGILGTAYVLSYAVLSVCCSAYLE